MLDIVQTVVYPLVRPQITETSRHMHTRALP
jgi:hypothetical protein